MGSGRDHLFLRQRGCVNKGLHGGLAEAPSALVRPLLVVVGDPFIQIFLHFLEITVADAVSTIPAYRPQDDLSGKMPHFEIVHRN